MDYFFWDEIFGGKQGLAEFLHEDWRSECEPPPDQISVIITYVENFTGPQPS